MPGKSRSFGPGLAASLPAVCAASVPRAVDQRFNYLSCHAAPIVRRRVLTESPEAACCDEVGAWLLADVARLGVRRHAQRGRCRKRGVAESCSRSALGLSELVRWLGNWDHAAAPRLLMLAGSLRGDVGWATLGEAVGAVETGSVAGLVEGSE